MKLLVDEDIGSADAIATLTDDDPTNLLAGLLGKRHGAKKAVALFKRQDLIPLVGSLGIDAAISPRLLTASVILKYVRGGRVVSVFELPESEAETLEVVVQQDTPAAGRSIEALGLPAEAALVGAVVRGDQMLTPDPDRVLAVGDHVILLALPRAIPDRGAALRTVGAPLRGALVLGRRRRRVGPAHHRVPVDRRAAAGLAFLRALAASSRPSRRAWPSGPAPCATSRRYRIVAPCPPPRRRVEMPRPSRRSRKGHAAPVPLAQRSEDRTDDPGRELLLPDPLSLALRLLPGRDGHHFLEDLAPHGLERRPLEDRRRS